MSGSLMINGLMGFFALVTLAAAASPLLLMPKWMARVQSRRIDFLRSAIAATNAELDRPQHDQGQVDRLVAQRQHHVAALAALAPGEPVAEHRLYRAPGLAA
jgi:Tfp pilus assembly protein PilN